MWTLFEDQKTLGKLKTPYTFVLIEAPREAALEVFQSVFGFMPLGTSCACCGPEDFAIDCSKDEEELLCWVPTVRFVGEDQFETEEFCRSIDEFARRKDVAVIRRDDPRMTKKKLRGPLKEKVRPVKVLDCLSEETLEALATLKSSLAS